MDIITDDKLLERIEAFMTLNKIKPSSFGLATMGDGGLIKSLREGRSLSLRNAEKLVRYMNEYRAPDNAQAAA